VLFFACDCIAPASDFSSPEKLYFPSCDSVLLGVRYVLYLSEHKTSTRNLLIQFKLSNFVRATSLVAWWSQLLTIIPVLPWELSLAGEDPHSDHGLGSL
jgi:hypothetical protein